MDGINDYNTSSTTGSTPGSVPPDPAYTAGYGAGPIPGANPQQPYGTSYPPPGYVAPVPGAPNPGLATLLGFIPGVGAMYNGQFAKGLAHIVIFAVLTSLANHVNEIFGLLVAGWVFYMVFDAYQTARARRDGLQVPDPFGLNNIGERFGLGHGPNWNDFVARPTATGAQTGSAAADPAQPYAAPGGPATYPPQDYVYDPAASGTAYQAPPNAYYPPPAYGAVPPAGVPPYAGAYPGPPSPVPPPAFDPAPAPSSGLPSGAIWLIGLGVLALLSSLGHTYYFHGRFFAGSLLIFIGAVLLFQQFRRAQRLYPQGSAAARWYAVNSSRGAVFLIPIGIFMLLDAADVARWHYTWPYLLILIGVYQIATRTAYNRMIAETPSPYADSADPVRPVYTPPPPAQSTTSIVPTITPRDETRNEEGR